MLTSHGSANWFGIFDKLIREVTWNGWKKIKILFVYILGV
jgi:hypothetical protein